MVAHFERLGGTLRLDDPVDEIITDGARATGLLTKSGWHAQFDAIASNGDVVHSYGLLRGHKRGAKMAAKLKRARFSPSLFVVHFGVRGDYPDIRHHTILFGPRYEGLLGDIYKQGQAARRSVALSPPSQHHRSDDGAGRPFDLLRARAGAASRQADVDWAIEGPRYRDRIIDLLEQRLMPGLRERITTLFHYTPQRFRRRSRRASRLRVQPRAAADPERLVPRPQSRRHDPQPLFRRRRHASGRRHSRRRRQRRGDRGTDDR